MSIPNVRNRSVRMIHTNIAIGGKETPVFFPSRLRSSSGAMTWRLNNRFVQRRLFNELHVKPSEVGSIVINPNQKADKIFKVGKILLSQEYAKRIRGDAFCLVLGGGTDRIFVHLGLLEAMEKAGIKPDFIVGTSAGSIIGALYAYYGSVQKVKEIVYQAMRQNNYQDVADLNLKKLRDGNPLSGLLEFSDLLRVLEKDLGLKGVKFTDLKIPMIICGVNANDGLLYLFAKKMNEQLTEDPATTKKSRYKVTRMRFYGGPITVAEAARASASLPGGAVPFRTVFKRKVYDWIDGGVRMNNPVPIAFQLVGVKDILLNATGFCGMSKGKFGEKSFIDVFMHAWDISGWRQLDDMKDNDYEKEDVSVRGINTGAFNVQTPRGFLLAQRLVISAKESTKKLIKLVCGRKFSRKKLFSYWGDRLVRKLEDAGFTFEEYSRGGRGVYFMIDTKSPILTRNQDDPYWRKKEKQDGGKLRNKPISKGMTGWMLGVVYDTWGLFKTFKLILHGLELKYGGYIKKNS